MTRLPDEKNHRLRSAAWGLLALLWLNAALSFSTLWPTPFVVLDARIAPEFVGLWVVVLGWSIWQGSPGRVALNVITAAYLLLVLGRYADVTVPSLFGRPINAYWDIPQIPRFLWVSAQEWPMGLTVAVVLGVVAGLALLFALLRWGVGVMARSVVPVARSHPLGWVLTAGAVALAAANYAGVQATWPYVSKPVVPVALRQAQVLLGAWSTAHQSELLPTSSPVDESRRMPDGQALAALGGADVVLMPLESLGAITYDDPQMNATLQPARDRLLGQLQAGGYRVVSAFLKAPTFAGGSDLSHLSLLSGIDLTDPLRHDVLLTTQRETLVTLFRSHGYQTFGVYPGVFWEWPERAFYRFDVFVDGPALGYQGPEMGYWKIPDQFAVAQFERLYPRQGHVPPRFVFFPTITNHLPFSPVPPYQPDWDRLLGPNPFDSGDVARVLAEKPNWTAMRPDYVRMVQYKFQWLGAFLQRPAPRETVYILVGDHQPAANVTGEGASWDVPVHVVARDERLLQRLVTLGYASGLNPPRTPLGGLHDLTDHLLQVFSAAGPRSREPRVAQLKPQDGGSLSGDRAQP